jgi:hypothetical protein
MQKRSLPSPDNSSGEEDSSQDESEKGRDRDGEPFNKDGQPNTDSLKSTMLLMGGDNLRSR